jgi:predicted RNA binding protein YcfA (HicA-like mRNA interferase family)
MTQYEKILKKFLENPYSLNFSDIKKILEKHWYEERQGKWSHTIYTNISGNIITIPIHWNDCKNFYKKKIKKTLFWN